MAWKRVMFSADKSVVSKRTKQTVWRAYGFALLLAAPGAQQRAGSAESADTTMESFMRQRGYQAIRVVRDKANHWLVKGKLDGAPVIFQLDTGSPHTFVTPQVARNAKESSKKVTASGIFDSDVKTVPVVVLERMELDGIVISKQPAGVLLLHVGSSKYIGSYIAAWRPDNHTDVLLGDDFLAGTSAMMDCGARTLYVRGREPGPELATSMDESFRKSGFTCVALNRLAGHLYLQVSVNARDVYLLLDTGAACTVLDRKWCASFDLRPGSEIGRVKDLDMNLAGLSYAKVASLRIGRYEQENFPVGLVDFERPNSKELRVLSLVGLLGSDLLGQARALIDCSGEKLYLRPRGSK